MTPSLRCEPEASFLADRISTGVVLTLLGLVIGCVEMENAARSTFELSVRHVATIGDDDGPGIIGGQVQLSQLRDGRYALYDMSFPGIVRFFGQDGAYSSTLGSPGTGPGEFQMPILHFLDMSGDTLVIWDTMNARLSALSPDGGTLYFTRNAPIGPQLVNSAFLENGWLIANFLRLTPDGVGLPLHLISTEGDVVHSFGTDFPFHIGADLPRSHFRNVDVSTGDTVWVVPAHEYRIERWSPVGPSGHFVLDTLFTPGTIDIPPAEEFEAFPGSPDDSPPSSWIRGVWKEEDGPVWVAAWVTREDWAERVPEDANYDGLLLPAFWRTRLEAFDPDTGQLLGSTEVEELWMGFIGNGAAYSYGETRAGVPYLDVWQLSSRSADGGAP